MTSWLTLITISSTQFRSPKRCSLAPSSSFYAPKSPGFYGLTNRNLQRCSFLPQPLVFSSSPFTHLRFPFIRLIFSVCVPLECFHSLAKSQNASLQHKVEVWSSSYLFSGVSLLYFLYKPIFCCCSIVYILLWDFLKMLLNIYMCYNSQRPNFPRCLISLYLYMYVRMHVYLRMCVTPVPCRRTFIQTYC